MQENANNAEAWYAAKSEAEAETLGERIERLSPLIESTKYALTEDDVRWDYESGRHRYGLNRPDSIGPKVAYMRDARNDL